MKNILILGAGMLLMICWSAIPQDRPFKALPQMPDVCVDYFTHTIQIDASDTSWGATPIKFGEKPDYIASPPEDKPIQDFEKKLLDDASDRMEQAEEDYANVLDALETRYGAFEHEDGDCQPFAMAEVLHFEDSLGQDTIKLRIVKYDPTPDCRVKSENKPEL